MPKEPLVVFSWQAPEYKYHHKNPAWYITLVIIITLLIIYQIIQTDYFGALTLGLIGIIVFAFARHKPKNIPLEISDQGVHINNDLIPYTRIRQFWIIDDNNHKTLNFETTAYINHILTIELQDLDSEELYEFLADILPEHEKPKPTLAQRFSHWFKF